MSNIADSVLAIINEENLNYSGFVLKVSKIADELKEIANTDSSGFAAVAQIERVRKVRDMLEPFVAELNTMLGAPETEDIFNKVIAEYKQAIGSFFEEAGYAIEDKESMIEATGKTQSGSGALIRVEFRSNDTVMTVKVFTSIDHAVKEFKFNLQDTAGRIVNNVKEAIAEFNKNSVDPVI